MLPTASQPVNASFPSDKLTIGAGVAIFHIATARVVVCYHSQDHYYFLPKGRRNANEDTCRAAEREGFEESGYRNRLLPLPLQHRQPDPDEGHVDFVTEPVWTQLLPLTATSQYLLFWYVAETIPEDVERGYATARAEGQNARIYRAPTPYPAGLRISDRMAQDELPEADGEREYYEPKWHEGTGVDEEELLYRSYLMPIREASIKLRGSVMADVIRKGWEGVSRRLEMEQERLPG